MRPKLIGALVVLAAAYWPTLAAMAYQWQHDTYSIHGMFVPLFSAHFIWTDRDRLREAVGPGSSWGLPVMLAALLLLVVGHASDRLLAQGVSLVVYLVGAVAWIFGERVVRAAKFPLGFLLLMVPFPHAIVSVVTGSLQLFAARVADAALSLSGVPFFRSGVYIHLPTITLEIAELCNGLRFLLALLVLTIAFAELMQPTLTRKLLMVLSAIPIAVAANAVRVAVVSVGAYYIGHEVATGTIHHTIGKIVWAFTLLPMAAVAIFLKRRPLDNTDASPPQSI